MRYEGRVTVMGDGHPHEWDDDLGRLRMGAARVVGWLFRMGVETGEWEPAGDRMWTATVTIDYGWLGMFAAAVPAPEQAVMWEAMWLKRTPAEAVAVELWEAPA